MTMDAEKKAKVEEYINENEQTQWFWKLADVVEDLTWLKEETESWQENGPEKWFLKKWLKNDESMLAYAELVMKTEKLSWWESIKQKLLELKLSITCKYFEDFKDFLQELKRWTDTSTPSTTSSTATTGTSVGHTETASESGETSSHTFCWINVNNIKSEPFERNSRTWVTWCSKTARNNWKNFWIILPSWNAYDAGEVPGRDSIQTIPADKINQKPDKWWKWLSDSKFKGIKKGNFADIYVSSKSSYGHRAAAFKDNSWQWYVLDPYTRVIWKLDNSPKKLEDYLTQRKILKAHIYESNWYLPDSQEAAKNPKVETAVQWAIGIAEDNCHWYERWSKWKNWQYDCSGLVTNAFKQAWFNVPISWTAIMRQNFTKAWFEWISPYDSSKLQRWDILLKDKWKDGERHTEIYTWNWKFVWARSNKDWKSGDSSWNEIAESSANWLRTFWWNGILRYRW